VNNQLRQYAPFISPFDPCPPIKVKTYLVPPNVMLGFQPPNLPQFSPAEALKAGTLWPAFYSPYEPGWG
jgi:spore coat protein JA